MRTWLAATFVLVLSLLQSATGLVHAEAAAVPPQHRTVVGKIQRVELSFCMQGATHVLVDSADRGRVLYQLRTSTPDLNLRDYEGRGVSVAGHVVDAVEVGCQPLLTPLHVTHEAPGTQDTPDSSVYLPLVLQGAADNGAAMNAVSQE